MSDLGFIIFALIFGFIFFGPHNKAKDSGGGKGGDKGGGKK